MRPIIVALSILLSGCAGPEVFRAHMDDLIGQPVQEAFNRFGYNYVERPFDRQRRAFTWRRVFTGSSPGYQSPSTISSVEKDGHTRITVFPGSYFPPQRYRSLCEFTVIVDTSRIIQEWQAQGDGCTGPPGPATIMRSRESAPADP